MRRKRSLCPKSVGGEKLRMRRGSHFEQLQRHREKGISRHSRASLSPIFQGNQTNLRRQKEGDDPSHSSWNIEKRMENLIDCAVGFFCNLSQVERFIPRSGLFSDVVVEKGEYESCEKQAA